MESNDRTTLALAALSEIQTGVIDLGRYTADATWWWNTGSTWPIGEFAALLAKLHALTAAGIKVMPVRTTAEGGRVSIEAESRATLRTGAAYHNRYHFMIVFTGDHISEVREYSDTHHVLEVFQIPHPEHA